MTAACSPIRRAIMSIWWNGASASRQGLGMASPRWRGSRPRIPPWSAAFPQRRHRVIEATTATRPVDLEGSLSILGENGSVVIGGFAVNKLTTGNSRTGARRRRGHRPVRPQPRPSPRLRPCRVLPSRRRLHRAQQTAARGRVGGTAQSRTDHGDLRIHRNRGRGEVAFPPHPLPPRSRLALSPPAMSSHEPLLRHAGIKDVHFGANVTVV